MDDEIRASDGYNVSLRKTRQGSECSMSSQRLEEIVGALMKPIKDMRQNFDMDLNSLLEEYLTEAGLRQLNEREHDESILPNFAEVAMILQQSANIYSKKVDYLWLQVVEIIRSFGSNDRDIQDPDEPEEEEANRRPNRTKQKTDILTDFEVIELEEATNINLKENADPKPLPVLPKTFIQFEPRIISENDVHIHDYSGQLIGVTTDFRCNWNTDHNGVLCDDLDFCVDKEPLDICTTNPAQSPDSGHCSDYVVDVAISSSPVNVYSDMDMNSGPECNNDLLSPIPERDYPNLSLLDTPIPETLALESSTLETITATECLTQNKKKRKMTDGTTPVKSKNSKYDITQQLSGTVNKVKIQNCCFEIPSDMIDKIVQRRKNKLQKLRRKMAKIDIGNRCIDSSYILDTFVLKSQSNSAIKWFHKESMRQLKILATDWDQDFFGFDDELCNGRLLDAKEFHGFTQEEADESNRRYSRQQVLYHSAIAREFNPSPRVPPDEHCDIEIEDDNRDSFFSEENFSADVAITNRLNAKAALEKNNLICSQEQLEIAQRVEEWHTSIRASLARAERRQAFDMWSYSSQVLSSFKSDTKMIPVVNFSDILKSRAQEDKARYFLATLVLANSLNVEIIETDPIECQDFQLRLLSTEKRVTDEDINFFRSDHNGVM